MQVIKRNGQEAIFDKEKIIQALYAADGTVEKIHQMKILLFQYHFQHLLSTIHL